MRKHEIIPISILIVAFASVAWTSIAPTVMGKGNWPSPLENAPDRQKLLRFGMYVTPDPDSNPINPPERFTGYHTGLDFEILISEYNRQVSVFATCQGQVKYANSVDGYGGVIVQSCKLKNKDVSVLYGHLDPSSFVKNVGDNVEPGEKLAILASQNSPESGFTRKHLHFGIHKGTDIVLLGYVQSESELANFIDPENVLAE